MRLQIILEDEDQCVEYYIDIEKMPDIVLIDDNYYKITRYTEYSADAVSATYKPATLCLLSPILKNQAFKRI